MQIYKKLTFVQVLTTSIISFFTLTKCYNFLYDKIGWQNLNDFYCGVTVYNNHNKYLDIAIYFVFLLIFFVILALTNVLCSKLRKKDDETNVKLKLKNKFENIKPLLLKLQYVCAFGYIFLHPLDGNLYPILTSIIFILIALSIYDIYKKQKRSEGFSILAITAFLFIFMFNSYKAGTAPIDDHHFGEKFAVYFMHVKFNLQYYKDLMLVHGFLDVLPASLGNIVFGQNNVNGYCMGEALCRNLIFIVTTMTTLFVFSKNVLYIAPLLLVTTPAPTLMFVSSYLAIIKKSIIKNYALIFWVWIILAIAFSSYWTTMGSFWIIASLPLFIYSCIKIQNRKKHFIIAFIAVSCLILLCFDTISAYLTQAKYYVEGTLPAFGNDFIDIRNKSKLLIVFEWTYKTFALFFTPILIIELINQLKTKEKDLQKILFLIFPILLVFCSLTYTLGRVDNGGFPRLEFISFPFLCLILPYWCYKFVSEQNKIKFEWILTFVLIIAITLSSLYSLPWKIKQIFSQKYIGSSSLYNVGNVKMSPKHESRIKDLKDFVYRNGENSTFFDLTNRGMHYLYLNKKIPVLYTSYYNSITTEQACESVKRLKDNPPDYILVYSNFLVYDRVFPSLRINPIYRWMLLDENYKYEQTDKNVFLVKTTDKYNFKPNELENLDNYLSENDLKFLPEVWADSIKTLPLTKIEKDYKVTVKENEVIITFDKPQSVKNIDLLYLKTKQTLTNYLITINGSNSAMTCSSKKGEILVPLDNFPSWLLNNKLKEIKIITTSKQDTINVEFYNKKLNAMP